MKTQLLKAWPVFFILASLATAADDLVRQFGSPPSSARPWVYWFWLDRNITQEGITADLEAMQRVGLGGALWMWGGGVGEGVKGPVKFLSPEWFELIPAEGVSRRVVRKSRPLMTSERSLSSRRR